MQWVPFTVYIKVVPESGKRFERIRDLQKLSYMVYNALSSLDPDTISIAKPGGGQASSNGQLSSHINGTGAKLGFGQQPALLMLTGFHKRSLNNNPTSEDYTIISGNETYTGQRQHTWLSNPTTQTEEGVVELKSALDSAINSELPVSRFYSIYKLDYAGVIYGNKGLHFPQ